MKKEERRKKWLDTNRPSHGRKEETNGLTLTGLLMEGLRLSNSPQFLINGFPQ
jgi:hypothetical protein